MSKTRYVTIKRGPWPPPTGILDRLLRSSFFPKMNPDFDKVCTEITHWWLEIDASEQVHREIGFDAKHRPVFMAPFRKNIGVLIGDDRALENCFPEEIDAQSFEQTWQAMQKQYEA
jgi:hypothetical protein